MRACKAMIPLAFAMLAICAFVRLKREHIYLSSHSPSSEYTATLTWVRVFPYIQGVDCYLTVTDSRDSVTLRRRLLQNRDSEADIRDEFTNLSWQGSAVALEGSRIHYSGEYLVSVPIQAP